jgi:hypothetical protein
VSLPARQPDGKPLNNLLKSECQAHCMNLAISVDQARSGGYAGDHMDELNWNKIETQAGADALMRVFGDFHDGCIREAHLWTDHWVSDDLSMSCPANLDNRIRFCIQRQFRNPSAIELLFEEVTRFNLVPTPENYCTIIFGATLLVRGDGIYWSPDGPSWSPESSERDECTWISAKKLRWRPVDWLGPELHYGPQGDE